MEFDLGEFGRQVKYSCLEDKPQKKEDCPFFKCAYTHENIEEEMLNDLKDPSICGAKEPKIAALMWILHEDPVESEKAENKESKDKKNNGILSWLGTLFK